MDRITDRPNMTSAVFRGHKASTKTNKHYFYKYTGIKPFMYDLMSASCEPCHEKTCFFAYMLRQSRSAAQWPYI